MKIQIPSSVSVESIDLQTYEDENNNRIQEADLIVGNRFLLSIATRPHSYWRRTLPDRAFRIPILLNKKHFNDVTCWHAQFINDDFQPVSAESPWQIADGLWHSLSAMPLSLAIHGIAQHAQVTEAYAQQYDDEGSYNSSLQEKTPQYA